MQPIIPAMYAGAADRGDSWRQPAGCAPDPTGPTTSDRLKFGESLLRGTAGSDRIT